MEKRGRGETNSNMYACNVRRVSDEMVQFMEEKKKGRNGAFMGKG
jgi:hypothetical protein